MLENNQNKSLVLIKDLGTMKPTENSKYKKRFGLYKCYCGNEFKTMFECVRSGHTKSCGCLQRKTVSEMNVKNKKTHGLANHRIYSIWQQMIQRCYNEVHKDFINYGSRGIKVCIEWHNIENFIKDMYPSYKEGLSIDRANNDMGYSKDNCRWANRSTQNTNTRKLRSTNKSGYRGVHWYKTYSKWVSIITFNKKAVNLGYFEDKVEAAHAYDKYVIDNNLEHTKNFS